MTIERRPPRWNWASIGAPVVGIPAGVFVASACKENLRPGGLMDNPEAVVFYSVLGVFGVLGLVAALIARFRNERIWGLTVIGMVVNAIISLFFVVCNLPLLPSAFK